MKERYLGLDLGTKTCGVSITDKTNTLVSPKCLIKFAFEDYEFLAKEIEKIVKENGITHVVIGLPINMDGTKGFACQRTLNFIPYLESLDIDVIKMDERLTTVSSKNMFHSLGIKEKDFKDKIDIASAVTILESYLRKKANEQK